MIRQILLLTFLWTIRVGFSFAQSPIIKRVVPNQVNLGHLVRVYGQNMNSVSSIKFANNSQFFPVINVNDTTLMFVVRGTGSSWDLIGNTTTTVGSNFFTFNTALPSAPAGNPTFCNGIGGITRVRILGTNFDTGVLPYCISGSPKFFNNLRDTLKSDTTYQVEIFHSSFNGINLKSDYNRDGDFNDYGENTGTSVSNQNGSVILTLNIPQHTSTYDIPLEISNSSTTFPGNGNDQTSYWNFTLHIMGSVGGPSYCYTNLLSNCPPTNLQIDSVLVPELGFRKKVSPCSKGYSLVKNSGLTFVQGRTYSLNLKQTGTAQAISSAWLDMNRNGNFSDQLPVFQSNNLSGPPEVGSFTVPINTSTNPLSTGTTRLRIRLDAGSATMTPCNISAPSTQTIDYLTTIEKATPNLCIPTGPANGCTGSNGLSRLEIQGTAINTALACPTDNSTYQFLPLNTQTEDTLETRNNYIIRVQSQFAGVVAAWADWRGDGRLLANDWLGSAISTAAGQWVEISFTVPSTAKSDRLLFRLRTNPVGGFEPLESCASTTGITYDFTMVIKPGIGTNPIQYCAAVQTNPCTPLLNSLRIKGTTFNLINPTCTGLAYRNFEATGSATASLLPGQNYILSWSGVPNLKVAFWADWNMNGIFEESEFIGGSVNSFFFRRNPLNSSIPQVRIRIRASDNEDFSSFDACTQRGTGITFDFTLSTPQSLCTTPLKKSVSCDTAAFWVGQLRTADKNFGFSCADFQNTYIEKGAEVFDYNGYSNLFRMDSAGDYAGFGVEFLINNHPSIASKRVAVWADWNGNEIFEANEFTSLGPNTDWKNIVVGAGAIGTTVRVRYRVKEGSTAFSANQSCTPFSKSLTFDFFLDVGKSVNTCPVLINRRNCSGTPTNFIERLSINKKPLFDFADICINPPVGTEGFHAFYPYGPTRANLQAGSSATIEVKLNTPLAASIVFGWVDWDQDGTYFPTEYFVLTGSSLSQYQGTVNIPSNAKAGVYNVRVRHYPLPAFEDWPSTACKQLLPYNSSDADFSIRIFEDCPAKPTIQTPNGTVVCQGGAVQLVVNANGNQVVWSNGQTTPSISVFTAGTYRVALRNSVCLSDSSEPVQVTLGTIPAAPTISAPVTNICQGDSVLLSGPVGFATYQWSNNAPNQRQIWIKTSQTIFLRVSNGCISPASAPVTITVSTPPPNATTTPTGSVSLCSGDSVLVSAPVGFQYLWSTGQTTRTIWAKNLGIDYTVRLISGACTSAVSPVVNLEFLPKPPTPSITASGNLNFCSGDSVRLSAPIGFSYQWSNGASTREIWVKQSGTFTVRTFLVANCLSNSSNAISVSVAPSPPKPNISPVGNIGICQGDSVQLTAIAGGVFPTIWSTGATTPSIWVKTSGSYSASIVLGACTSQISDPKLVVVSPKPTQPTITVSGATNFCQGDSVRLTAVFSGNGVQWSNGSVIPEIWVKRSGSYTVQSLVNAACQSDPSLPVIVTVNPRPKPVQISAPANPGFCQGDSVLLTAPAGFSSYRWSNGKTSASIYAKSAGSYSVQVAGANGCFSDTLGFFSSGLYFFPAGASDGDSIHIFMNSSLTCPLPAQNPVVSMQGSSIARLHSGVTLNGTDWQNVVESNNATIEPQTRFRNLAGGWFLKSILPKNYYNLGNQTASQLCLVTNGGNAVGGWFEKEGKRVTGGPCADFFIPLPIPRNVFSNPFAVTVTLKPSPAVSISQTGNQLTASPIAGLTFQWLLNGQPIVGATGFGFTVNQSGSYQVVATNNQNCRDTSNVILITSTELFSNGKDGFNLFPNPFENEFQIVAGKSGLESAKLELYDILGKSIFNQTIPFSDGKYIMNVEALHLPNGTYQIRIIQSERTWEKILIKL